MDILKLSYSGRLSFGKSKRFTPDPPVKQKDYEQEYLVLVMKVHGIEKALALRPLLGLSSVPNLQKSLEATVKPQRGARGMTSASRVRVRDAACLLQDRYGRARLTFLTLTIPPSALKPRLFQNWTAILKKLRQWIAYHQAQAGLKPELVGVTEIQEGRQKQAGGLPCLHLHLLFVGRGCRSSWFLKAKDIDEYWSKLLSDTMGEEISTVSSCRLESIKKNASGYLGKYMSKGTQAISSCDPQYLPPSWHMLTRGLLHQIKKMAIRCEGKLAEYLYDYYSAREELFRFSRLVKIEVEAIGSLTLGWYGDLKSRDVFRQVREEITEFRSLISVS